VLIALRIAPAVAAGIILGAHFLRAMMLGPALVAVVAIPVLLLMERRWAVRLGQLMLVAGTFEWLRTTVILVGDRRAEDGPWLRLLVILGAVTVLTGLAAYLLGTRSVLSRVGRLRGSTPMSVGAAVLTLVLLVPVQFVVDPPGLLIERFVPTFGWVEIGALALYAAWLAEKMIDPQRSPVWRRRVWALFSAVFFGQLIVGLLGVDSFLMTGKLHLPVPAVIIGGPLYRGSGFFMPILSSATIILVGPAWCSHLCYIGAWDDTAARSSSRARRPRVLPSWHRRLQATMLAGTVVTALGLRLVGAPWQVAVAVGAAFGLGGVGVMVIWSRRVGAMTHCVSYCPIGLVSTTFGRVNPFRVRIASGCDGCGACSSACRYGALRAEHIEALRPGPSCTLCGDCVGRCRTDRLGYRLFGMEPGRAREVFITLVVALHAGFLGVARL
jgi:ferredoxin